ncbi:MAG: HAD-IB family phosphatase [Planctomycetota bacterium]|nr:HAD-IB family phosphatase [Planctomycetota bacterium]
MRRGTLILDFDSTIVSVEALDELARMVLKHSPTRDEVVARIEAITRAGMEGSMSIQESLAQRMALLSFSREALPPLIEHLRGCITPSFAKHRETIAHRSSRIHVVSGGFIEWVAPVCESLGILGAHCHANRLRFDSRGQCAGIDPSSTLARAGGKPQTIRQLRSDRGLYAPIVLVGDGATDLEAKQAGAVEAFVAYTEHAHRPAVAAGADAIASSFDEVLQAWDRLTGEGSWASYGTPGGD